MFGKSLVTGIALICIGWPLPGQQRVEMATVASSVLQHTDVAHQAITHGDTQTALDRVRQALAATDQLLAASKSDGEPLRVPIASDFEGVSTMVPAKRHGSADRLQHNASISEVNGWYTATILNVSSARTHLLAAQTALEHGDRDAADLDLAAAQGDVTTKSISGDLPLVQAKDNLDLALTRVRDGNYKDAILPLKSAARALDRFAHQSPAPPAADVASRFSIGIDAFAERIAKDHDDAADRITGWLDRVTDWFYSGMQF
jgi:YfdX protein